MGGVIAIHSPFVVLQGIDAMKMHLFARIKSHVIKI